MALVVGSDEQSVVARFDHLYSGFPTAAEHDDVLDIALVKGTADDGEQRYDSYADGELLHRELGADQQELKLTRLVNERKLDAEPELLHLHSAAVARDGTVVVLPARSGGGKSSLAAALVRAGWTYLTDEQVAIDPATSRVLPYPRPITLRSGSWASFPELGPWVDDDDGNGRCEVAPIDLGAVGDPGPVPIGVIIEPSFDELGDPDVSPSRSAAATVESLASCCYDIERLGATGVAVLAELAGRCAGWRLRYRRLDDAVASVEEIVGRPHVPISLRHLPPAAPTRPLAVGELVAAADAHAWEFGDGSAIVFGPAALRLTQIDRPGIAIWEQLSSPVTRDELVATLGADHPPARDSLLHWIDVMVEAGLVIAGS